MTPLVKDAFVVERAVVKWIFKKMTKRGKAEDALILSADDYFGPRMEYVFYAALVALLECQNVTLLSLQRMLSEERYRMWVVRQVKDPIVRQFWEREFEAQDISCEYGLTSKSFDQSSDLRMYAAPAALALALHRRAFLASGDAVPVAFENL